MDLQQYQKDVTRTESLIETIQVNKAALKNALLSFSNSAETLDAYKKSVFYNNDQKLRSRGESHEKENWSFNTRTFHGIIGVLTEAGELAEILIKALQNSDDYVDTVHVQEELGDLEYYVALLHDELKINFKETFDKNIRKLRIRYPEAYSNDNAETRDLDAERKALEK